MYSDNNYHVIFDDKCYHFISLTLSFKRNESSSVSLEFGKSNVGLGSGFCQAESLTWRKTHESLEAMIDHASLDVSAPATCARISTYKVEIQPRTN